MDEASYSSAGFILKTEKVKQIDSNIVPDTLVADGIEPFPGYHGDNIPEQLKPLYVFLFLKHPYTQEEVIRATARIKKYCNNPFEAHYTILKVFNNDYYYAIRLRRMEDYAHIRGIQECFMDEGFEFMRARKLDTTGILKVYKFFSLVRESEGVYRDDHENCIHYLEMPGYMNWKLFVDLTRKVKQNSEAINFDAALASMYNYQDIREFVRIYCFKDNKEQLYEIRKRYMQYYEYMKKML